MGIKRLEIAGFKSIDSIELTDLPNYCVFAGANGAGKSNFFDAMKFASTVIDDGAVKAIRRFHGYERIHCVKRRKNEARTFRYACKVELPDTTADYSLEVHLMNQNPQLKEKLTVNTSKKLNGRLIRVGRVLETESSEGKIRNNIPQEHSLISHGYGLKYAHGVTFLPFDFPFWLKDFKVFRFDPLRVREPDDVGADVRFLDENGRNLTTILEAMQKRKDEYDTIMEWITMIVPGLVEIHTHRNPLDGRVAAMFQETGTDYLFPPGVISDGTFYVLCLLAAVLTRFKKPGITLIEEPESGIHPKAIEHLSQFFREHASDEHQIFISTHNESFVRSAKAEELFFVVKEDGRTRFRLGRDAAESVKGMPNDKAWLQNMFDGGLPW